MSGMETYRWLLSAAAGLLGLAVGLGVCRLAERDARGALCDASVPRRVACALICGLAFFVVALRYGLSPVTLELGALSAILLALSLADLDRFEIPNGCVLAALAVRVAYLLLALGMGWMTPAVAGSYVLSALGVGLVLLCTALLGDWLFGIESLGGGDLKLLAVAALYVGWEQSLLLVALSCMLGLASSPLFARTGSGGEGERQGTGVFPFGPSIAVACLIVLVCGGPVLA